MSVVLSAAVVVFGVLVFLLLGAQVEMFRDLAQLREAVGLVDRPRGVDLGRATGARPSAYGLPAALDSIAGAIVLFLSDKCATCRSIAASIDGDMPNRLWLVLDPAGQEGTPDLAITYEFNTGHTVVDSNRTISSDLNITLTPVALIVQHGRIQSGTTVPSTRQLYALLERLDRAKVVDLELESMTSGKDET
jgi:hypothetical protein